MSDKYCKVFMSKQAEQVIAPKRETATFLSRCPLNSSLRVAGFALGELRRSAFLG
jgi:hypothetical protein